MKRSTAGRFVVLSLFLGLAAGSPFPAHADQNARETAARSAAQKHNRKQSHSDAKRSKAQRKKMRTEQKKAAKAIRKK